MKPTITGRHLSVTAAMEDYIHSKLERVIRHFEHMTSANVILSIDNLIHKAEITVHVPGKEIFVESHHEDMYAAIDSLVDKLDRQVLKYKHKAFEPSHESLRHHVIE